MTQTRLNTRDSGRKQLFPTFKCIASPWEHRTLRSIQPSRVLARLIEDEWNLYENRVAVRLVDHLLAYVARRLAELNKVERSLHARKEHIDVVKTSFWRADRITTLWARALDSKIEYDLRATRQQFEHARRDLQALLDAPLYQQVPRRARVALSLRPTNILINDPHYRKVAALWRAWVKLGHKRQETREQRAARRQLEARAWEADVSDCWVCEHSGGSTGNLFGSPAAWLPYGYRLNMSRSLV